MQATLESERLMLRPFAFDDAKQVQLLAGDKRVSEMTSNIPHPYHDGIAEQWICTHRPSYNTDGSMAYAIIDKANDTLMGAISLVFRSPDEAELGYWLGVPYWGLGYATEATQSLLEFADKESTVKTITARHLTHNDASRNVIVKCGFRFIEERTDSLGSQTKTVKYYERLSPP